MAETQSGFMKNGISKNFWGRWESHDTQPNKLARNPGSSSQKPIVKAKTSKPDKCPAKPIQTKKGKKRETPWKKVGVREHNLSAEQARLSAIKEAKDAQTKTENKLVFLSLTTPSSTKKSLDCVRRTVDHANKEVVKKSSKRKSTPTPPCVVPVASKQPLNRDWNELEKLAPTYDGKSRKGRYNHALETGYDVPLDGPWLISMKQKRKRDKDYVKLHQENWCDKCTRQYFFLLLKQ